MQYVNSQLPAERLVWAKAAYTTRRVRFRKAAVLLNHNMTPSAGDLVLARVEKIGHHQRLELANGRRARLFVGDEILVCYGNCYAPNQFEAVVPDSMGPCDLAASGGIAARVLSKHKRMKKPTKLVPLGLLGDIKGQPLNLSSFALQRINCNRPRPVTVAIAGTAMDAGKTTTAASLIKGLTASGLEVGAAKVTGTGAGGDMWFMKDAGANPVLDPVDLGFSSTYRASLEQVQDILGSMTSHLRNAMVDVIVLEVADGLYQAETTALLSSPVVRDVVDGIIFAARDAMGANAGVEWLWQRNLPVLALGGVLTSSPLAVREVQEVIGLPVLDVRVLSDPAVADMLKDLLANQPTVHTRALRAV